MPESESVIIVLPLPARVLSPNCPVGSIGGRFARASASKRYRRLSRDAVLAECIETAPWKKVAVQAAFYHRAKRRRDQDNAMASLKAAYDGIVDTGLVPDDDYEHMRREAPTFEIDREHPRVVLTITRCDE